MLKSMSSWWNGALGVVTGGDRQAGQPSSSEPAQLQQQQTQAMEEQLSRQNQHRLPPEPQQQPPKPQQLCTYLGNNGKERSQLYNLEGSPHNSYQQNSNKPQVPSAFATPQAAATGQDAPASPPVAGTHSIKVAGQIPPRTPLTGAWSKQNENRYKRAAGELGLGDAAGHVEVACRSVKRFRATPGAVQQHAPWWVRQQVLQPSSPALSTPPASPMLLKSAALEGSGGSAQVTAADADVIPSISSVDEQAQARAQWRRAVRTSLSIRQPAMKLLGAAPSLSAKKPQARRQRWFEQVGADEDAELEAVDDAPASPAGPVLPPRATISSLFSFEGSTPASPAKVPSGTAVAAAAVDKSKTHKGLGMPAASAAAGDDTSKFPASSSISSGMPITATLGYADATTLSAACTTQNGAGPAPFTFGGSTTAAAPALRSAGDIAAHAAAPESNITARTMTQATPSTGPAAVTCNNSGSAGPATAVSGSFGGFNFTNASPPFGSLDTLPSQAAQGAAAAAQNTTIVSTTKQGDATLLAAQTLAPSLPTVPATTIALVSDLFAPRSSAAAVPALSSAGISTPAASVLSATATAAPFSFGTVTAASTTTAGLPVHASASADGASGPNIGACSGSALLIGSSSTAVPSGVTQSFGHLAASAPAGAASGAQVSPGGFGAPMTGLGSADNTSAVAPVSSAGLAFAFGSTTSLSAVAAGSTSGRGAAAGPSSEGATSVPAGNAQSQSAFSFGAGVQQPTASTGILSTPSLGSPFTVASGAPVHNAQQPSTPASFSFNSSAQQAVGPFAQQMDPQQGFAQPVTAAAPPFTQPLQQPGNVFAFGGTKPSSGAFGVGGGFTGGFGIPQLPPVADMGFVQPAPSISPFSQIAPGGLAASLAAEAAGETRKRVTVRRRAGR